MNTKQTNLFILLLFLAGISTAVGAPKEELRRVLDKRVQEDGLEQMAWFAEEAIGPGSVGISGHSPVKNFSKMLETTSSKSKNTLLRHYSLKGNLPMVQCLVEANADVSAKNEDDWSALTLATRNKKIRVVKYLLNEGDANVDIKDRFGQTALMAAAMDDWPEMVKFFIEQKANLSEKDLRGWTALEYATVFGSNEPRDILFEAQDKLFTKEAEKTDSSRLICAVGTSDLAMVKQYVYRNIVDVNSQDNDGWTALMQAVENGDKKIVKFLVSKKADVNERDEDNKTAE